MAVTRAIANGQIIGRAVNLTRELVNAPADEVYPETFAARAAEVARQCGLQIEVWEPGRLKAERCGRYLPWPRVRAGRRGW